MPDTQWPAINTLDRPTNDNAAGHGISLGSQPNEQRKRFRFIRSNYYRYKTASSQAWKKKGTCPIDKPPDKVLVAGDGFEPPTFGL